MDYFFEEDNKGYVIRRVDRDTGRVTYRGSHKKYTRQKDALSPKDTYTFTGAKKALLNWNDCIRMEVFIRLKS